MADAVREFIDAFNSGDLDAFVETLDPDVEIHAGRGLRRGVDEARLWATRAPGGVQQTIVVDERRDGDGVSVALITRHWHWDEDGSPAGEDQMAWVFELRGGRVASWMSFDDRVAALAHAGL
ncbi:MAG: nuclear transport factor 2 family protein [Solirubrobacterales bacterium]